MRPQNQRKEPKLLNKESISIFVSYEPAVNMEYLNQIIDEFGSQIIGKSRADELDLSLTYDDYIDLIKREEGLNEINLLIVLISPKSKCYKHIDWEISAILDQRMRGKCCALLGLFLPEHTDFGAATFTPREIPFRLDANLKSGHAVLRDWPKEAKRIQPFFEEALSLIHENCRISEKVLPLMQKDNF